MRSESTSALGQPSETNPTRGWTRGVCRTTGARRLVLFFPFRTRVLLRRTGVRLLRARGRGLLRSGDQSREREAREHRARLVLQLFLHLHEHVAALVHIGGGQALHRGSLEGQELI